MAIASIGVGALTALVGAGVTAVGAIVGESVVPFVSSEISHGLNDPTGLLKEQYDKIVNGGEGDPKYHTATPKSTGGSAIKTNFTVPSSK